MCLHIKKCSARVWAYGIKSPKGGICPPENKPKTLVMSKRNAPPSQPPRRPLIKQHSWSPDADREEAWLRRKGKRQSDRLGRSKSVTDEDLEELRGCIELGFGFEPDSQDLDPRLNETLPALGLYCAVNKQYSSRLSRTSSLSSIASEGDVSNSSTTIVDQGMWWNVLFVCLLELWSETPFICLAGDDPETMKLRLKQWAQVVACSVRQFAGEPNWCNNNHD